MGYLDVTLLRHMRMLPTIFRLLGHASCDYQSSHYVQQSLATVLSDGTLLSQKAHSMLTVCFTSEPETGFFPPLFSINYPSMCAFCVIDIMRPFIFL